MPSATVRPWGGSGHTRTAGLVLVALVHVALVGALVEGFRRHAAPKPPPLTQVTVEVTKTTPVPVTHIDPPVMPRMVEPQPRWVDIPDVPVVTPIVPPTAPADTRTAPTATATATAAAESGSTTGTAAASTGTAGVGPATREPVSPGMVCTSMGAPEMPSVHWTGDAVFRAVAEVQAGRVVAVEIRALQGGMDVRTRRAFSLAIETALRQHYVCPGNHRFQQDFGFRVD